MEFATDQEKFWVGNFGDEYIARNADPRLIAGNVSLFSEILRHCVRVNSVTEFGCNIGNNLEALRFIDPSIVLRGVEINQKAYEVVSSKRIAEVTMASILNPLALPASDLTFTKGVLIHVNPEALENAYRNLVDLSSRYVAVVEYYSPSPVTISYRGYKQRLFKRDFAGELMDRYALKLISYGFRYRRDNCFPQDDLTWFLLEK